MKPFKTYVGAQKRAAFEQTHQNHLKRKYVYYVERSFDGRYVIKRKLQEKDQS